MVAPKIDTYVSNCVWISIFGAKFSYQLQRCLTNSGPYFLLRNGAQSTVNQNKIRRTFIEFAAAPGPRLVLDAGRRASGTNSDGWVGGTDFDRQARCREGKDREERPESRKSGAGAVGSGKKKGREGRPPCVSCAKTEPRHRKLGLAYQHGGLDPEPGDGVQQDPTTRPRTVATARRHLDCPTMRLHHRPQPTGHASPARRPTPPLLRRRPNRRTRCHPRRRRRSTGSRSH